MSATMARRRLSCLGPQSLSSTVLPNPGSGKLSRVAAIRADRTAVRRLNESGLAFKIVP